MIMRRTMAWLVILLLSCAGPTWTQESTALASPHYELSITINPDAHRLDARGTLRLTAADKVRDRVRVRLSNSMEDLSVEIVEPQESQGKATVERAGRPSPQGRTGTDAWDIIPRAPFPVGKTILLRLSWSGGTPGPDALSYVGPEVSFASGFSWVWYPQYVHPSEGPSPAVGRLTFRVPNGLTVIADGVAEVESKVSGEYRFAVKTPTYFSFAAGKYTVVRKNGSASKAAYLLRSRENTQSYLDGCAKVFERLEQEYGPDPYGAQFAIVEIPTEQFGGSSGASFPNFIFISSTSLDAPFNPVLFGHEIGHLWWGNLIKLKGNRGRYMLDEGMAQYSALMVLEHLVGPQAAERLRRHGDPAGPIEMSASTYFALIAAGLDHPLSQLPNDWNSRNVVNTKGPLVVDLLARTVGRDRFRRIVQQFLKEHAFSKVTWEQFAEAFNVGTQGWSRRFFSTWFDKTGAPDWRLTWVQEGKRIRGTITQDATAFGGSVDIEIRLSDGRRTTKRLEIEAETRTDFNWRADGQVQELILDPEYRVLHWTQEYHTEAPLLAPYWNAFTKDDSHHEEALSELGKAIEQAPANDTVGVRFALEELTARLLASDEHRLAEAKAHLERGLMSASRRNDRLGWAYWLLGYLASKTGDRASLEVAIQGAIAADAVVGGWSGWGSATRALRFTMRSDTTRK